MHAGLVARPRPSHKDATKVTNPHQQISAKNYK